MIEPKEPHIKLNIAEIEEMLVIMNDARNEGLKQQPQSEKWKDCDRQFMMCRGRLRQARIAIHLDGESNQWELGPW